MAQFRSYNELAQELEEKERLLQATQFQAQLYKEDAERANVEVHTCRCQCAHWYNMTCLL